MGDPSIGVEHGPLVIPDGEVRAERTEGEAPTGPQCPGNALQHQRVVATSGHQPKGALTEADDGVELGVEPEGAGVEALERRALRRGGVGEVHEALRDVHAVHRDTPTGKFVAVPARPASDIEHALTRLQTQCSDDCVDLLAGPLRKRVAEIGIPEVVREGFEPVVGHGTAHCALWFAFSCRPARSHSSQSS